PSFLTLTLTKKFTASVILTDCLTGTSWACWFDFRGFGTMSNDLSPNPRVARMACDCLLIANKKREQ
ncbi:hypothetical protein, partial [Streptococcus hyovaginalis]